ncbi:hypothetical protein WJX72_005978 [[Myrmecia] bisecta]|uniref:Protein arginine methyltransferase NDUFAF7 n=1 Tax=[Myrmecia] bisecta TaxID=41462 RepID=A0AAW1PHL6_9CHLO
MARHIKALIRFRGGPITLAEYMSEVLTNPTAGYYMHRDVFGGQGDFTTSPEVSQLFGEMVGIWCLTVWQQLGQPRKLRLVELGPGRGTLMADLLRGTAVFQQFAKAVHVDLVEVSTAMRDLQWGTLRCEERLLGDVGPSLLGQDPHPTAVSAISGAQVRWHHSLDEVPSDAPAIYLAHEFFDALPVHQFQRTERGWCERLVDLASPDSPLHLRLVLSPGPTPASQLLVERRLSSLPAGTESRSQLEVSPQGMATAAELSQRVAQHGGAALIVDYGQEGPYAASLQAIRSHKFVSLLEQPGKADLSARVDFGALRSAAEGRGAEVACHGLITQAQFLQSLGIQARLESLLQRASPPEAEMLQQGYMRLVGGKGRTSADEEGMGESYKALAITCRDADIPVAF